MQTTRTYKQQHLPPPSPPSSPYPPPPPPPPHHPLHPSLQSWQVVVLFIRVHIRMKLLLYTTSHLMPRSILISINKLNNNKCKHLLLFYHLRMLRSILVAKLNVPSFNLHKFLTSNKLLIASKSTFLLLLLFLYHQTFLTYSSFSYSSPCFSILLVTIITNILSLPY